MNENHTILSFSEIHNKEISCYREFVEARKIIRHKLHMIEKQQELKLLENWRLHDEKNRNKIDDQINSMK